jgi:hypothetical protein
MAKGLGGRQAVPLEAIVLAQAFQLEALMNVLERQGVITKTEVLKEITRLRETTVKARAKSPERRGHRRRGGRHAERAVGWPRSHAAGIRPRPAHIPHGAAQDHWRGA